MNYQNNINTYADITAYNADHNKDYPNVSYISGTDEVKYVEIDPNHIVATYNITDTSAATTLLSSTTGIASMTIDGVQQESVVTSYQFSTTGEHIVKYSLSGTTLQIVFYNLTKLKKITLPNGITNISQGVFEQTKSIIEAINIPNTVTSIGSQFVDTCSIPALIFNSVTPPTGASYFNNWDNIIYVPKNRVNAYKSTYTGNGTPNRIFTLPVQRGGEIILTTNKTGNISPFTDRTYTFYKEVYINGVLQTGTPKQTYAVSSGDIMRCVLYDQRLIPRHAFSYKYSNAGFKKITLPSTIESIGEYAFAGTNLTSVTCLATTPPALGTNVFQSNNCTIYVPAASVDTYKAASGWSTYASRIQAIPTT